MNGPSRRGRSRSASFSLIIGAAVNFAVLAMLVPMAWLKEQPMFWRAAGGWPAGLREFVGMCFYPALLVEFLLLLIFTGFCLGSLSSRGREYIPAILLLLLLWAVFLLVMAIVVANNVDNLLTGRPLHWHAD